MPLDEPVQQFDLARGAVFGVSLSCLYSKVIYNQGMYIHLKLPWLIIKEKKKKLFFAPFFVIIFEIFTCLTKRRSIVMIADTLPKTT